MEAMHATLQNGGMTRFHFEKVALQAATETVMVIPMVTLAIMKADSLDISGLGFDLPDWTRILLDLAIVNGDLGLFSNLALSYYSLYTGLGNAAQWVTELDKREKDKKSDEMTFTPLDKRDDSNSKDKKSDEMTFTPNPIISIIRVLEIMSVSVAVVIAMQVTTYDVIYKSVLVITLLALLPKKGCDAIVLAVIAPVCPLAMAWPWDSVCCGWEFLWYHGVRCAGLWTFWCWTLTQTSMFQLKDDSHLRDGFQLRGVLCFVQQALVCGGVLASLVVAPLVSYVWFVGDASEEEQLPSFLASLANAPLASCFVGDASEETKPPEADALIKYPTLLSDSGNGLQTKTTSLEMEPP
jgi:hypothetical protein